jgi:hypothetical protein
MRDFVSSYITLHDNVNKAYQTYKSLKNELQEASQKSQDLRDKELRSCIHEEHEEGSTEYAERLKNIQKGEASRKAWQTLKFLPERSGATQPLNRLDIPMIRYTTPILRTPNYAKNGDPSQTPTKLNSMCNFITKGTLDKRKELPSPNNPYPTTSIGQPIHQKAKTSSPETIKWIQ